MDFFKQELNKTENKLKALEAKYSTMSAVRFIVFLIMAADLIVGFFDNKAYLVAIGFVALVVFFALVFSHGKLNEQVEYTKARVAVIKRYMARFTEDWKKFPEDGAKYLLDTDLVARDMDIIGPNSLFQFIQVAGTNEGKVKLAETLRNPEFSEDEIAKRQSAIKELVDKTEFSLNMETLANKSNAGKRKKGGVEEFLNYCVNGSKMPVAFNVMRFLLPAITFVLLILAILGISSFAWPIISFFVVLMISWCTSNAVGDAMTPMLSFGYIIEDYINMFDAIANEDFESDLLCEIKEIIAKEDGALFAIRKLNIISAAFNVRFNPLVDQILSGLILWNYHLGFMMDSWREKYGAEVATWINAISSMEELLSFAVLGRTREVSYPSVTSNADVKVTAKSLRHPLISPENVVANDADFTGGTTIITGSNMSGKTTFLRTLGTNLVLAYAGAPVLAESLTADYMKIFTSMRVTDDISGGISTFYAEILRIKTMVEYKKEGKPMLCLIDEIFKGTNSADRIVGATQVIKKLSDGHAMTVVSTHDFELCDLKNDKGEGAANYHFEEYYEGDELRFDYLKKDGRCTTTNAMAILKMAGLN